MNQSPTLDRMDEARHKLGELADATRALSYAMTHLALALDNGDEVAAARWMQHVDVAAERFRPAYDEVIEPVQTALDRLWTALNQEPTP